MHEHRLRPCGSSGPPSVWTTGTVCGANRDTSASALSMEVSSRRLMMSSRRAKDATSLSGLCFGWVEDSNRAKIYGYARISSPISTKKMNDLQGQPRRGSHLPTQLHPRLRLMQPWHPPQTTLHGYVHFHEVRLHSTSSRWTWQAQQG